MKNKVKLAFLYVGSFLISIAPLAVAVGINFGRYTQTTASSFSLCFGGVIACVFALLKALGKLPKSTKRVFTYGALFAVVCLLEPLIYDIKLLSGMALLGEALDTVIFMPLIAYRKKKNSEDRLSALVDKKTEEIKELLGEGRV